MKDDFNQTVLLSQLSGIKILSTFLMSFNKYKMKNEKYKFSFVLSVLCVEVSS